MLILIMKNIANSTMYTVQELHIFPKLFTVESVESFRVESFSSIFSLHSSIDL